MAVGGPAYRDSRDETRRFAGARGVPRQPFKRPPGKAPRSQEPLPIEIEPEDKAAKAPTQIMAAGRMAPGKPPAPTQSGRIPLTKEQICVGRVLLAEGPITADMVRRQIEDTGLQNSLLAKAVVASGHVSESEMMTLLLTGYRIPKVKLANYKVPHEALRLIPAASARRHKVVPLGKVGSIVCVAVGNIFELDVEVVEELRRQTGCLVKVFQSSVEDIESALEKLYPAAPKARTAAIPVLAEMTAHLELPHDDSPQGWDDLYASAGPLKAVEMED